MPQIPEISDRAKTIHFGLKEKSFGIKDIRKINQGDVRQLRYWISLGVVTGKASSRTDSLGWDKFSFYEFMWILLVCKLKEMNFDNHILIDCAKKIFSKKDPNHANMLLFEKAILYTIIRREDVFFMVNKQGNFDLYRITDLSKVVEQKNFSLAVLINLLPIIKEFLLLKDFRKYIIEVNLLKDNETKVLEFLDGDSEIKINVDLGGKEIIIQPGERGVKNFIETIFTKDYKKINVQL